MILDVAKKKPPAQKEFKNGGQTGRSGRRSGMKATASKVAGTSSFGRKLDVLDVNWTCGLAIHEEDAGISDIAISVIHRASLVAGSELVSACSIDGDTVVTERDV